MTLGNRYPVHDSPIGAEQLQRRGCRQGGQDLGLSAVANSSNALILRTRPTGGAPVACWARLAAFEIEIKPELVAVYLDEANAPEATRRA